MTQNALTGDNLLPQFDILDIGQIEPTINRLVADLEKHLSELETNIEPTWDGSIERLTQMREPLNFAWDLVNHMMSVQDSPELRKAHEAAQPTVVALNLRLSQSEPIYRTLKDLRSGPQWKTLDEGRRRVVEEKILDAELRGVGLEGKQKARFQDIEKELAELSTKFENNLLDATKAFSMTLTQKDEVEGLPETLLGMTAQSAALAESESTSQPARTLDPQAGPWRITLDGPIYAGFMQHARRQDLREKLYRANIEKASAKELDNQPIVLRILKLRREMSALLGYKTYAEVSLARKMAADVPAVGQLLDELRGVALPRSRSELADLTTFAREQSGETNLDLKHWDVAFWAERRSEQLFGYTDEELRPYFALPRVLAGLFEITNRMFGVSFKSADGETTVWDPSVQFFKVLDADGDHIAYFYLDPYSRPQNKRGGAWMNFIRSRHVQEDGSVQLPVVWLICNQSPPVGDQPSLMSFEEVNTLFHEFGHGLQHMLTKVDFPEASGVNNIEWDAVELASTFMQNWCYHKATILGLAKHFETGDPLPDELFEKIRAARTYLSGSTVARQVYLSEVDMELHHEFDPNSGESPVERSKKVALRNIPMQPLPEDRAICGFAHIFAGSYAAGYYSYAWAAVLAADAFAVFEEEGTDDAAKINKVGRRFADTFMALGGTRHPMDVFKDFRGRAPTTEPLLKQLGLK